MLSISILTACGLFETGTTQTDEGIEAYVTERNITDVQDIPIPVDEWADINPQDQTVIFWHQYTNERGLALQHIVDEFNRTNEFDITVIAEYQGDYGDLFYKMLDVVNTMDVPDLVEAYQYQAATYQIANALVDMTSLFDSDKWGISETDRKDFFNRDMAQEIYPTFGNSRLSFPQNRLMEVLYYNIDWLNELGYNNPPTTPEEFMEMACKATNQPFRKATSEGNVGYEMKIDASIFASWTFAFGGDIFDYDNVQFSYNNEAAIAAMTFVQTLFANNCGLIVKKIYADQTDFGAGLSLFTIGTTSELPFYHDAVENGAQFEWSIGAIPYITAEPVMNIYGSSLIMPNTNRERELASWLFLKYFTSSEVQSRWAKFGNYLPIRASVAKNLPSYFEPNSVYKTAFELMRYSKFEPSVPGYEFVREIIKESMVAIVDGGDVVSILDRLNEEANITLQEQLSDIPKQ